MSGSGNLARAFSPLFGFRVVTWGLAPGWFEDAPLALTSEIEAAPVGAPQTGPRDRRGRRTRHARRVRSPAQAHRNAAPGWYELPPLASTGALDLNRRIQTAEYAEYAKGKEVNTFTRCEYS